ncbi:CDP-alcohol phosphatidyltransferase family protein [Planctomycetota bacterium]|nr:CDP-alcohol phosphatidyltransferase family protein [Planctomycetota bacterium]
MSDQYPSNLDQSSLASSSESDRRPIATRQKRWSQKTSHFLSQKNIQPNHISVLGACFGIAAGCLFAFTGFAQSIEYLNISAGSIAMRLLFLLGACCVQFRLLCNMFDGMVAIERGISSRIGAIFNEVPDRISDIAILVGLGYAYQSSPTLGYVAAIMAIMTAYIRVMGKVAGGEKIQQHFSGWMDKSKRMFFVTTTTLWLVFIPTDWYFEFYHIGIIGWLLLFILIGCTTTSLRRLFLIMRDLRAIDLQERNS